MVHPHFTTYVFESQVVGRIKIPFNPYLLLVELTDVLERLLRLQMESPQLTTPPLVVMLKVRRRYRSSDTRGLYGFSGSEHTRGRECSTTVKEEERFENHNYNVDE